MANPTDNRLIPMASARLFDPGGDNVLTSEPWCWYDILRDTADAGSIERDANGQQLLEPLIDNAQGMLTCKPFLVLQSTAKTSYSTSGGSWSTFTPGTKAPRISRLYQYSAAANLQWSATSTFNLPENPHFALSYLAFDSPADHDATTYPPYLRFEFGGANTWAIEISKTYGNRFLLYSGGGWQATGDIKDPVGFGGFDSDEKFIFVRHLRGRIYFSTDFGKTYDSYDAGDGSTLVPAGKYTVRGQGGAMLHGLHQLRYYTGSYTSPQKGIALGRAPTSLAIQTGRGASPYSTALAYTDLSTPTGLIAQYKATLTPASSPQTPFTFYYTPELYVAQHRYPPGVLPGSGNYTTPWDGAILQAEVDKPFELDGATATLEVRADAATAFSEAHRWRKVQLVAGFLLTDNTVSVIPIFTGLIAAISPSQETYNHAGLRIDLDNVTARLKVPEMPDSFQPLGAQTVNQAADALIFAYGFTTADRVWHPNGDRATLAAGLAEDPALWPKEGDRPWDWLVRVMEHAGLEVGATDDGRLFSYLKGYVAPGVVQDWQANPATDATNAIKRIANRWNYREQKTGVIYRGGDQTTGRPLYAYLIDGDAELNPNSPRFSGIGPHRLHERAEGTTTQGMLNVLAQTKALDVVAAKCDADLSVPAKLSVSRRDRVTVSGTVPVGINATDEFWIVTLHTTLKFPVTSCETSAGLRRIVQ